MITFYSSSQASGMGRGLVQLSDQRQGSPQPKVLGVTSPINTNEPKPIDIQRSKELEDALNSYGLLESERELNHRCYLPHMFLELALNLINFSFRMDVLAKMHNLVTEWIKIVSLSKNMPQSAVESMGGKIYTFGSYRLGVHTKGADIDTLCVAPRHIERSDFFTSFVELLKEQKEVKELRVSEDPSHYMSDVNLGIY